MMMTVIADPNLRDYIFGFQAGQPLAYWLNKPDKVCEHGYLNILRLLPVELLLRRVDALRAAIWKGHLDCAAYVLAAQPGLVDELNDDDDALYFKTIDREDGAMFMWMLKELHTTTLPAGEAVFDYLLSVVTPTVSVFYAQLSDNVQVLEAAATAGDTGFVQRLIDLGFCFYGDELLRCALRAKQLSMVKFLGERKGLITMDHRDIAVELGFLPGIRYLDRKIG
jgi:hypothetical protein